MVDRDGLGMIQAHYMDCILYFCYYTSFTSDHQALDPGAWGTPASGYSKQMGQEVDTLCEEIGLCPVAAWLLRSTLLFPPRVCL